MPVYLSTIPPFLTMSGLKVSLCRGRGGVVHEETRYIADTDGAYTARHPLHADEPHTYTTNEEREEERPLVYQTSVRGAWL